MVSSLTPRTSPSPKMGVPYAPTYANGHISATGDPIHFMFGSRVGFSWTADLWRNFQFEQIQDGGRHHLEKISNGHISATVFRSTSCLVTGWGFRDGGSNGAIFDSNKFKMAAAAILDNFEWRYLRNCSRSTYIARIARSSLRQHSFLVLLTDGTTFIFMCYFLRSFFIRLQRRFCNASHYTEVDEG